MQFSSWQWLLIVASFCSACSIWISWIWQRKSARMDVVVWSAIIFVASFGSFCILWVTSRMPARFAIQDLEMRARYTEEFLPLYSITMLAGILVTVSLGYWISRKFQSRSQF